MDEKDLGSALLYLKDIVVSHYITVCGNDRRRLRPYLLVHGMIFRILTLVLTKFWWCLLLLITGYFEILYVNVQAFRHMYLVSTLFHVNKDGWGPDNH